MMAENEQRMLPLLALLLAMALQFGGWGTAYAGANFMHTGGRTTQPVGHYEFCQKLPQECRQATPKQAPTELTRGLWAKIVAITTAAAPGLGRPMK